MGTIWVKELVGGLDTRRMPETTPGGVLMKATDGHITRGGEFEKRAAFVPTYPLVDGYTLGLAGTRDGLVVFGHLEAPDMPDGVAYQQLEHPDGETALTRILSHDLYAGILYVVGEFADGSRHHFYNGQRITDWFDGRARASFSVTAGDGTSTMTDLTVNGVSIIGATVTWATSNTNTAALIAAAINADTSSPEYTATSVGEVVNVIATTPGPTSNGYKIVPTVTNGLGIEPTDIELAGGADPLTIYPVGVDGKARATFQVTGGTGSSQLTALTVNGVSIITGTITWATSNAATAAAIAASINAKVSNPEYTATVTGDRFTIISEATGTAQNGFAIVLTVASGLTLSPTSGTLAGGVNPASSFQPGSFVRTFGTKLYSVSDSNLHFSGIDQPTKWTTNAVGAGFVDMTKQASGTEQLEAVAPYQNNIAVFSESVTLIFYVDPDPNLNRIIQVLGNTGTGSPRSVTQFGDNDIFYLDESGLRSLRARDSSNSAATTDIGVPVDSLIVAKLQGMSDIQRDQVIGLINPSDGRFWLIMGDEIFVFSFYANAKVSAWTTYVPSYEPEVGDEQITFHVEDAVIYRRKVYVRSGDMIYAYGGVDTVPVYDDVVAEAWLPYFDADRPTAPKQWQGIDAALEGEWEVLAAMQPTNLSATDRIGVLNRTTYNEQRVMAVGNSSHISLRFRSKGDGPAKLSAVVIHYAGDDEEK